jgi:hypothetical protein
MASKDTAKPSYFQEASDGNRQDGEEGNRDDLLNEESAKVPPGQPTLTVNLPNIFLIEADVCVETVDDPFLHLVGEICPSGMILWTIVGQ